MKKTTDELNIKDINIIKKIENFLKIKKKNIT